MVSPPKFPRTARLPNPEIITSVLSSQPQAHHAFFDQTFPIPPTPRPVQKYPLFKQKVMDTWKPLLMVGEVLNSFSVPLQVVEGLTEVMCRYMDVMAATGVRFRV